MHSTSGCYLIKCRPPIYFTQGEKKGKAMALQEQSDSESISLFSILLDFTPLGNDTFSCKGLIDVFNGG